MALVSAKAAALCELCRSAPLFDLPELKRNDGSGDLGVYTDRILTPKLRGSACLFMAGHNPHPPGFKHQCGREMLQKSAQTCKLCGIIEECVRRFIPHVEEYLNDDIAKRLRPGFNAPESWQLWLSRRRQGTPGFAIHTDASHNNNIFEVGQVAFVVEDGE